MDDEKQQRTRKIGITALALAFAFALANLFMALDRAGSTVSLVLWGTAMVLFAAAFLGAVWGRPR